MPSQNTSVSTFSQVLLWSGAAISIAEIMTGALLAPLGIVQGISAIILGHLIGGILLYLAGLIGAKSRMASAQSTTIAFGRYGSQLFALLNLLQLIGWTAVMIIIAARAFDHIVLSYHILPSNFSLWCVIIGLLVILWVAVRNQQLQFLNLAVVSALLLFILLVGGIILQHPTQHFIIDLSMPFGNAVELNVAMAMSWLPLISDYTRKLEHAKSGTFYSTLAYVLTSTLMFIIGLAAAIYAGTSDIIAIFLQNQLGLIALFVVVFSTVTTTYLDVYSAGVCLHTLYSRLSEKSSAILITMLGTILAITISMEEYENFLFLIGTVFAPAFAILLVDYYLLNRRIDLQQSLNLTNAILWLLGVVIYQLLKSYSTVVGMTLPVIVVIGFLTWLVHKIKAYRT